MKTLENISAFIGVLSFVGAVVFIILLIWDFGDRELNAQLLATDMLVFGVCGLITKYIDDNYEEVDEDE